MKTSPYNQTRATVRYHIVKYTTGMGVKLTEDYPMFPHYIALTKQIAIDLIADDSLDFFVIVMPREINFKIWWQKLKKGGYFILADLADISQLMKPIDGWLQYENRNISGINLCVYRKVPGGIQKTKPPIDKKKAAVVRYGGYGDLIQASGIFTELKKQDYHLTVITDRKPAEVIKHDPRIDDIIALNKGQVPAVELLDYWNFISREYHRWINLVECSEGPLLAYPDRLPTTWPKKLRHKMMNYNYSEFLAEIAEVDFKKDSGFFWTNSEEKEALKFKKEIGGTIGKILLWVNNGSSVNKIYPHSVQVINELTERNPYLNVVIVGDVINHNFAGNRQVFSKCGTWSIRQSMTMACIASDVVLGPETGIMNACCYEDVPKIVLLSHSTVKNLTLHWTNTTSLFSEKCECYPCHRLHYGWNLCRQDKKTGAALCQEMIYPYKVITAVERALK